MFIIGAVISGSKDQAKQIERPHEKQIESHKVSVTTSYENFNENCKSWVNLTTASNANLGALGPCNCSKSKKIQREIFLF